MVTSRCVEGEGQVALATFTVWSAAHGLTMLIIDNLTGEQVLALRNCRETYMTFLRYCFCRISWLPSQSIAHCMRRAKLIRRAGWPEPGHSYPPVATSWLASFQE